VTTPWWLLLSTLCTAAALGPEIGIAARGLAAVAVVALVAAGPRRPWIWLGLATGAAGAWRLHAVVLAAAAWPGGEVVVHLDARGGVGPDRLDAWIARPDRPAVRARLRIDDTPPATRATARVRLDPVPRRRNPDEPNRRRAALARRTLLRGRVLDAAGDREPAHTWRDRWKDRAREALERRLGGSASLWAALLLGERDGLPEPARRRLARMGLAHLLALSGLHVGLVWVGLQQATRRWTGGALAAFLGVALWCVVVGFSPSLTRALALAGYAGLARALRRPASSADGLAWIAWAEFAAAPWRLCGVGWWLSYVATLALLRVGPATGGWPRAARAAAVCVAAPAATLPWAFATFGFVAVGSPLVNLVVGPLFAAVMGLGLILAPLLAVPGIGEAAGAVLALASHGFGFVVRGLDRVDGSPWGHPGLDGAAWAVAWILTALAWVPARWPTPRARGIAGLALLVGVHLWPRPGGPTWVTLDVGQGDAGVYRDDAWLVVDAGPAFAGWDAGAATVLPYLERRNARGVTLLLTHGHLDHTGGADALLRSGRVDRLVLAAADSTHTWTRRLGHPAVPRTWLARGDTLRVGNTVFRCLWPPAGASELETNDRSLVLAGGGLLLTGDLEWEGEGHLGDPGTVPVLKVAHHAGNTGTGDDLLAAVQPRWALVSCGRGNRYGHPHPRTLERLRAAGVEVLRTDRDGALTVRWGLAGPAVQAAAASP